MAICNNNLSKLINEVDDYTRVDRAVQKYEESVATASAVYRAKRSGKYADSSKRLNPYIDKAGKLIGKTLTFEDADSNQFVNVKVTKTEMLSNNVASINNGKYIVDMNTNMTTNGHYYVTLGSETETTSETLPLLELTGTVLQNIEDITLKMEELDGNRLSEAHKARLEDVISRYYEVLTEASKDVEIDVNLVKDLDERNNTRGSATPETGKINLIMGNQRHNSLTEVLAHELQHVMIRKVLEWNKSLEYKIVQLRDTMKDTFHKMYAGEGWKLFLHGIENPTQADIDIAKERWKYVFSNNYAADEFLAYATTNEQLSVHMELVTEVDPGNLITPVKETGRWTKMLNAIIKAINTVYKAQIKKPGNARDLALDMLDTALKLGHIEAKKANKSNVDKVLDQISKMDKRIAKYTQQMDTAYKTYEDYLKATEASKIEKAINALWKIRTLAKARSWVLQNNLFSSVTRDIGNPEVAKFYEMFRKSKAFVEKEVVAVKNKTAAVLNNTYGLGRLSENHRRASKRILIDTDAKVLGSINDIKTYLENPGMIDNELNTLTSSYNSDTLNAIDQLAELLVNNKMTMRNGYFNASQIVFGTIGNYDPKIITDVDKAVSLLALKKSSTTDKKLTLEAIEQEGSGLERALLLKEKDEAEILKKAYASDKMYAVKGAKQETFKDDKKHYLVDEKEMKELVKAGMNNIGKHQELSRLLEKDVYVVIGDSIDVSYTEGLMSVVQLKNEGDSVKRLLMEINGLTQEEAEAVIEKESSNFGNVTEALIPERSGTGLIYDYKFRLPYEVKNKYMNLEDDITLTIAGTLSNLTHKQEAMLNNRAALHYMNNFYGKHKNDDKYKFVTISEESEGKFKEYWDLIPYYLKREINKNPDKALHVEEGMLVDFFGYKDVSIINAPWFKNRKTRQVTAKKLEKIVHEMVQRWKKVIVAFTPATVQGNMMSNMVVALQHTSYKNPLTYMNKFREVWGMMNDYQDARSKKLELEIRRKAGEVIDESQIKALEGRMHANPISIIIEDGQYNAILEDIDSEFFDNKGIIESKIDSVINSIKKDKNRARLKDVVDLLYIRKDSRIHDSVMKLTNYSDAINKMIILLDQMEQNGGTINQGQLNYMDQLHVNYGYLDNRYVKYMNDLGFLTFTKYMFRVFPAMIKMLGNKTFTVFLTESTRKGLDIGETPFEQFYNPIDSLAHKITLWGSPMNVLKDILLPPAIK